MMTEEKKNNWTVIKCPKCGYELVPCEVFYPDDLTGTTKTVIRDPIGKILFVDYEEDGEPALVQHFSCPKCGEQFIVEATVSYRVKQEEEELDFKNQYTSLL